MQNFGFKVFQIHLNPKKIKVRGDCLLQIFRVLSSFNYFHLFPSVFLDKAVALVGNLWQATGWKPLGFWKKQSPLQVQRTRKDDMQNDFLRPAEMLRYRATLWNGISLALNPKVTFTDGEVAETNFYLYPFLKMKDAPLKIEVGLVRSYEAPTGLGEPALPPVVAGLANALFAATGNRIPKMPFSEQIG